MHRSVLALVLALPLAPSQFVWQQKLPRMELVQQQHLNALRTLTLQSIAKSHGRGFTKLASSLYHLPQK